MFEFAALAYGMIATFVMTSASRNRRQARHHSPLLAAFGWLLMAFSLTMGVGLLGFAGYGALTGGVLVA